jgi:hypothetical protein
MTNIRLRMSRLNAKKVPALSLILVAIVGMVAGVLAAIVVNTSSFNFTGEAGTLHQSSGTMTITDNGLSILSSSPGYTNTTGTFGPNSSSRKMYNNGGSYTAGDWLETIVFTDTAGDGNAHTVKITINSGSGPTGTSLVTIPTLTLTGPGSSSNGTITVILDLGTNSITSPMTVYVSST